MAGKRKAVRQIGRPKKRVVRGGKLAVPRGMRPRQSILSITRKFHVYSWVPGTASTNDFYRRNFTTLSAIPNSTEISTMFDYYRIRGIKFTWIPRYTGYAGNDTTDTTQPGVTNNSQVNVILGYDNYSNATPSGAYSQATINTMLEQGRCKLVRNPNTMFSQYAVPTVNYDEALVSGQYKRAPWLLCTNNLVQHYTGYMAVYDANFNGTNLPNQTFDCFITVYMQVKGLR